MILLEEYSWERPTPKGCCVVWLKKLVKCRTGIDRLTWLILIKTNTIRSANVKFKFFELELTKQCFLGILMPERNEHLFNWTNTSLLFISGNVLVLGFLPWQPIFSHFIWFNLKILSFCKYELTPSSYTYL